MKENWSKDKEKERLNRFRKTKKGVITNSYHAHLTRCRMKGWPLPDYSLSDLQARFINCPMFDSIYNTWVAGGYKSHDKPSIDRKDPTLPYSTDNIQILSWKENNRKGHDEKIITQRTQVVMCDMDGTVIKQFNSVTEAVFFSGCYQAGIIRCCQGIQKHVHGYRWKYGDIKQQQKFHPEKYEQKQLTYYARNREKVLKRMVEYRRNKKNEAINGQ